MLVLILVLLLMVVIIFYNWNNFHLSENFISDTPTIQLINNYITKNNVNYGNYLNYLVKNKIMQKEWLEQEVYFGMTALKKLNILTKENIAKLIV